VTASTPISPETSKYTSKQLLSWLWKGYLRKHTPIMMVAIFFMVLEGSMLGALSYMMQPMFDDVFVDGNRNMLYWVGILLVLIFVIRAVSSVVQKVLLTTVA
jgi:subfamily B ATP-binding cassette protein MsbA